MKQKKTLYNDILNKKEKVSLIGLGYVGLPIAIAFAKKIDVLGFDISEKKINQYKKGVDPTGEVGDEVVRKTTVKFSCNPNDLRDVMFHIVAVPTPANENNYPDLTMVESASRIVGQNLKVGSVIVFESTVYPGVTEDVCIPILESESGMKSGVDFKVGYSPERINPGDKVRRLENIVKVVSGIDEESLDIIAKVYELVVEVGVYRAKSIKVAEAAKVIENSQRDINIAFMNELSNIFHLMGIDTKEVLEAASTKWNFLNFTPGLVGGHCIGVDPYYLAYKAEQLGYHPQIILAGRYINDGVGARIANEAVRLLIKKKKNPSLARIGIFGLTFKENCPDTRNTKVIDIIEEFAKYDIVPKVYDPVADASEAQEYYGIKFANESEMDNLDLLLIAVTHDCFAKQDYTYWLNRLSETKIIMDVKGILDKDKMKSLNIDYWRL